MSATNYTIYDFRTGEILRSGSCPEKMLGLQVREGESILVGEAGCDVSQVVHDDGQGSKVLVTIPSPEERDAPPVSPAVAALRARYADKLAARRSVRPQAGK